MREVPLQEFQARSSPGIVSIPTRRDPGTGNHVVLWIDIQHCFEGAQRVMCGNVAVLFLTGDTFERLVPLRIACHPGVVLDVVVADKASPAPLPQECGPSPSLSKVTPTRDTKSPSSKSSNGDDLCDTNALALIVHPQKNSRPDFSAQWYTDEPYDKAYLGKDDTTAQDEQLHQLQQQIECVQQEVREMNKETRQRQQETDDVLRTLQLLVQQTDELTRQRQHETNDALQTLRLHVQQTNDQARRREQETDDVLQTLRLHVQKTNDQTRRREQETDDVLQTLRIQAQQSNEKTSQLQQQVERVLQSTEYNDRQTNQKTQQLQQRIDDALEMMQEKDDQVDAWMRQMERRVDGIQLEMKEPSEYETVPSEHEAESSPQMTEAHTRYLKESIFRSFDHILAMKSRAQRLLSSRFQESLVPRLFFVLPQATGLVDQDGRPSSLQFRLYYLCECGDHTMVKDGTETHQIHLAEHGGYDLDNHNDFFDRYGPYLLTMMHMLKYGATAAGRTVPPLQDLKIDESQEHPGFSKDDIGRLVNDMMVNLEDMMANTHDNVNPNSHWELDPSELAHLPSYLKVEGEIDVYGNLHRTTMQERHSVWICTKHQRDYHESTTRELKEAIMANDGLYTEEPEGTTIVIRTDLLSRRFLEAMADVRWVQHLDNQWELTPLDLKLGREYPTARILVDLNFIGSLTLDFERFSLTVGTKDGKRCLELKLDRIGSLTREEFESILRCHCSEVTMWKTPQREDEGRLVDILANGAKLEVLRIACFAGRSLAIINLITSTRQEILDRGGLLSLRTLEVMDEGLLPIDKYALSDDSGHIASTLTFIRNMRTFDMLSSVMLRANSTDDDPGLELIVSHGGTIETLSATWTFNDQHATLIRDVLHDRGSRITTLNFDPTSLTANGLDAMDEIIRVSPSVILLGLWLESLNEEGQLDKAMRLLRQYKERVFSLYISGGSIDVWLPQLMEVLPTRESLPKMVAFTLGGNAQRLQIPQNCIRWAAAMVSVPPRPAPSAGMAQPQSLTRLERLTLLHIELQAEDWVSLMEAIDFTVLESLDLKFANFSSNELEYLVNRVVGNDLSLARLRSLRLPRCLLDTARALRESLLERSPMMDIN